MMLNCRLHTSGRRHAYESVLGQSRSQQQSANRAKFKLAVRFKGLNENLHVV